MKKLLSLLFAVLLICLSLNSVSAAPAVQKTTLRVNSSEPADGRVHGGV